LRNNFISRWLLALFVLTTISGCTRDPLLTRESFVFGTRVEVQIWGEPKDKASAAAAQVLAEFDRLHHEYHAWQSSQLTSLNDDLAAGRPHLVSAELANLIAEAQGEARRGNYLFDPGIGNAVKLWGFHDDTFKPQLPDAAALEDLKTAKPSISDVVLSGLCPGLRGEQPGDTGCQVFSLNRSVALDFGGYLKGVALDHAAGLLRAQSIHNALINIGGNIIALGSKGGQPWRVGIQNPRGTAPLASIDLRDGEAIGTSGDYQRYFELNGKRYCHLIDPRTASPAQGTQSVTLLIAAGSPSSGMQSDIGSKPLFISGASWPAMAKRLGLSYVLRVDGQGKLQATKEMKARIRLEIPGQLMEVVP
jgi:FAD:protein FMN transferase